MEIHINEHKPCYQGRDKEIVSKDKRSPSTHIGVNEQFHQIRKFHIDGDVLPEGEVPSRCDYLILNDTAKRAYFIELKGRHNVKHGTEQVDATVSMVKGLKGYTIFCRVVHKKGTHNVTDSDRTRWKNKYHGRAEVVPTPFKESICHGK